MTAYRKLGVTDSTSRRLIGPDDSPDGSRKVISPEVFAISITLPFAMGRYWAWKRRIAGFLAPAWGDEPRIGAFASKRPLEVSHLEAERRRYPRLPSHRLWAKSPDSQLAVGRSEGLRRQIPHLQQRRGFPGFPKFTYNALIGSWSEAMVDV